MEIKQGGFTLIELMITIAVMTIIATMAAPSFVHQVRQAQLNRDARDVMKIVTEARSEAILWKRTRVISLVGASNTADTHWSPSNSTSWEESISPIPLQYNYFGQLVGNSQCFILKHQKDAAMVAILRFSLNGSVSYNKNETSC